MRNIILLILMFALQLPQARAYTSFAENMKHAKLHNNEMVDVEAEHEAHDSNQPHSHKHSHDQDGQEHSHTHSHPPLSPVQVDIQFLSSSLLAIFFVPTETSSLISQNDKLKTKLLISDIFRPPIA